MKKALFKWIFLTVTLLGLPLLGVWWKGYDVSSYLQFPPFTVPVEDVPFSWTLFIGMGVMMLLVIIPFLRHAVRAKTEPQPPSRRFPWWGWGGFLLGGLFWIIAWNRFPMLEPIQPHTFTPLWLCYIITINALTYMRSQRCMMLDQTKYFLLLFLFSAAFWWFFEYLNRFVQNWSYQGVQAFSPLNYFCFATTSFSTVLPATLSTRELLLTFPRFRSFQHFKPLPSVKDRFFYVCVLALAMAGLFGIGIFPTCLFPLLWISPLMIIVGLQGVLGEKNVLTPLHHGDWSSLIAAAVGAFICGFFWEMWNYYSYAKWVYHVPFVHRFQLFEMPILGYAGYLPFGVECLVVGEMVKDVMRKDKNEGGH